MIRVTWSRPSTESIRGKLLGYEITYTPAWKNASASRRVMLCERNTSFHLEKLSKYTLYNITVAAFTKVGIGKESEIEQTWTDEDSKWRLTWRLFSINGNLLSTILFSQAMKQFIIMLYFSNSSLINLVWRNEIMTRCGACHISDPVTDFHDFISPFLRSFSFDWEDKTLKTKVDYNSNHLEVRKKYSATGRVFNSLLSV